MKERKASKNSSNELFSSGGDFTLTLIYYVTNVDFSSFPGIIDTRATGLPSGG